MMYSAKLPRDSCPRCATKLDAATGLDKETFDPKPGDFSICINCQAILTYDPQLKLEMVAWEDLPDEVKPTIGRAITLMKRLIPVWKAQKN
jgi:hypothetical protein